MVSVKKKKGIACTYLNIKSFYIWLFLVVYTRLHGQCLVHKSGSKLDVGLYI